jgi:hypothetical protein
MNFCNSQDIDVRNIICALFIFLSFRYFLDSAEYVYLLKFIAMRSKNMYNLFTCLSTLTVDNCHYNCICSMQHRKQPSLINDYGTKTSSFHLFYRQYLVCILQICMSNTYSKLNFYKRWRRKRKLQR